MEISQVCKNVAHNGESYLCTRCGKAGFSSRAQAVGHQAQCGKLDNFNPLPKVNTGSDIVKNIDYDRNTGLYVCKFCGHTFHRLAQAKGHLSVCEDYICKKRLGGKW